MTGGVLLFDGDCGFCSTSALFTRRWIDRKRRFDIEPFQNFSSGQLAAWGLDEQRCGESLHFVAGPAGAPAAPPRQQTHRTHAGAAAVAATLRAGAPGWRPAGMLLAAPGISRLAEYAYRWVAAHRYRLPGGTPACAVDPAARIQPQPPDRAQPPTG